MEERGGVASTGRLEASTREEWAELRAAGAGLVAGLGAFFLVRYLSLDGSPSMLDGVLALPFVALSLSMLYAGFWLLRSDFGSRRVGRIAAWSLAGFLALVAISVWITAGQSDPVQRSVLLTLDVGAVGASTGLLVGLENERRQRQGTREAIAASLAAERAEDRFAFFNRLLRHHLLNGVAVVRGHAELLASVHDEPPEEVEIIRHRSDEIVALVRNVETLARAFTGDLPREPIDPVTVLREAIQTVGRERPSAELLLDGDDGRTSVVANDRVVLAFEALLRMAVGAAVDDRVTVTTGSGGGAFVVSFEFEGSVPPSPSGIDREGDDEGDLGYFLAETLIEHFGGTIDVAVTDETGLSVTLPSAE